MSITRIRSLLLTPCTIIVRKRACHAIKTMAEILSVACPFCMTMMEDGIKTFKADREVKVLDIAELLEGPNYA